MLLRQGFYHVDLYEGFTLTHSRAKVVKREYYVKARRLDARFHSQDPSPGPIENVLTGYDVQGLAIGAYGEASPEVHDMLQRISEAWAARYYVEMGYDDELQARSLCLTRARRRLATMAILNSAWLVHDRINDLETGDGLRRHRRRSDQEDAAYERFYARGDDYFHGARGG